MRLVVVGSAGSFPSADSAASAYLVQAEDADGRTWTVLLDLGSGALGPLQAHTDPTALDLVGISHLHADHVADLVVLNVLRRYRPEGACAPVRLHGPPGTLERLAQMAGKDPATEVTGQFDFEPWQEGVPVTVGPLTIEPVAVHHPLPSFGMRVSGPSDADPTRTVTLAYTGDTDECPGLTTLADGVDLLLAEAAYIEGRDDALRGVHLTGRRAGAAAAAGKAGRLVLTHLVSWNDPQATLAEARGEYDGPIDLARPGAVYPL
ncbi:MBL fold metallo-hydrolase [Cellulomonas timonensis]|uniref:MBL fold metallo-hydrolase n=1 Tax=Cellulomonas timonensis TaxID=1689271 RepID=UPI00082DFC16|nr:MBL fold metallo-hydrolase [Cellulomonas timonensis]